MWIYRPFTADEAETVANALDALYAASSQMVLSTCPIRAACKNHPDPRLGQIDDMLAAITVAGGGVYLRAVAIGWMRCWLYPTAYIRLVVGWARESQ